MALGETFDLGRIYAQAEAIKSARSDREYKKNYMEHLNEQERRHWEEMQQGDKFKSMYAEIQQIKALPEEQQREWLAKHPVGQDPRFKDVPTADLIRSLENGVLVGLGKNPMDEPKPTQKQQAARRFEQGGREVMQQGLFDPTAPTPEAAYQWGPTVPIYNEPDKDGGGSGETEEVTSVIPSAISNSIARAVADLKGGIVRRGPDGELEVVVLDPALRPEIVALRALAERLWVESNGKMTPGEAVQRADRDPGSQAVGSRGGARRKTTAAAAPSPSAPAAPSQPQQRAYNPQTGQWAVLVNGQWVIEK